MTYARFRNLTPGLHRNTKVRLSTKHGPWEGWVTHDVLYVNKAEKEVVLMVFSQATVCTADQFDSRGYELLEDK